MRNRVMVSGFSFVMVFVMAAVAFIASTSNSGSAEDSYEQRLSDLETRVTVLEEEVGIEGGSAQTNQQNNVSVSSSQSSVSSTSNQTSNSYSASFTANGDRVVEFEVDNAGTYNLTANVDGPFSVHVESIDGDPVPGFTMESGEAGSMTASDHLEPGTYLLQVSTSSMWSVIITSFGD